MDDATAALRDLLSIMARLRAPDGCPWDREQDFASIAPYTIEEAFEVADAIERHDLPGLQDELGDLLLQVVFHARMAEEQGAFDFAAVARSISQKMIRRHPHVFGEAASRDTAEQNEAWERQKEAERSARQEIGTLAGLPRNLPALVRAVKLTRRAARVGFDWPDADAILAKLAEETAELRAELATRHRERLADELGDMFFVLANLARKLEIDAEASLRHANAKFERRFKAMEALAAAEGKTLADHELDGMEDYWRRVKEAERGA
ncbi:nucleoside triphosphate pyrophosphohydrolase [Teichococcus oryzae]|uniref:Nucleoside triphosphate pyrophosphohydrolase n=1 Tax=Teichococcus oryzae TaxID=1608942 RepID=A0A5B2TL62_9PROT|nr:nucleoside triphosphate pyrophosphohydrolase [Pseudoroseomonas oryzae]KAA2215191.1 nucleoside triphosphate pyrophosphohydrolase [Pseudoroseomonas oryzae]